jgi:hypothetical protein
MQLFRYEQVHAKSQLRADPHAGQELKVRDKTVILHQNPGTRLLTSLGLMN